MTVKAVITINDLKVNRKGSQRELTFLMTDDNRLHGGAEKRKGESSRAVSITTEEAHEEGEEEFDDGDWTWESYTPGSSEEEMPVLRRKRRKGKGKELESVEGTITTATSTGRRKGKGKKKEKKGKKGKKIPPAVLEEMAKRAEAEAKQAEEEEKIRAKIELQNALAKDKKEIIEQALRMEQLNISLQHVDSIIQHKYDAIQVERSDVEWIQYQKCDGLPDPYVCRQMNAYLSFWEEHMERTTMDEAVRRTEEVLRLLDDLTGFIDSPLGAPMQQIDNWKWVRNLFRSAQQKSLDAACYKVLRDVTNHMTPINLHKSEFQRIEPQFTVCLWTMVELPTPMPNPRAPPRPRTELTVPDVHLQLVLPIIINCYRLAIRVMYLHYDHLSDLCTTYDEPAMPEGHRLDLCKIVREEWYSKLIFKYDEYRRIKKQDGLNVPEQEYDKETGVMPEVPYVRMPVSPSKHVISEEAEKYRLIRESLMVTVEPHEINLRKTVIIGGIFFVNLYFQPPQPQYCVSMELNLSRLYVPKTLKEVKFCPDYVPPDPEFDESTVDMEAHAKIQEEQLEKLVYITVQLPTHVMWLDTPTVCMWDPTKNVWTTKPLHDFKFLEETASVSFRTMQFGIFSFAMNRFTNLPYQTWEVKPETDGTVTVQLVAAILMLDLNVKENNIAIMKVQNAPNMALNDHLEKYYKLPKLKRLLLEIGVDIFPFFDAFCYVENSCEKHWQMEKHLYFQMAQVSSCYNFTWSRWNVVGGRRSIVMQMREYKVGKPKQSNFNMLHVTPLNAEFINCSEVSSEFLPEAVEGMAFYSDLYTLVKGICNIVVRNKIQNTSPLLVATVAELLQSIRILSFS